VSGDIVKKIIGLAMAGLVIIGIVLSGTWAFFSDPESSSGNQIVSGSLDLRVDGQNPWTSAKVNVGNMKPGDSGVATMTVNNAGTLAGTLTVDITGLSDAPGTTPEPEPTPDNGELSANLDIVIWVDTDNDGIKDAGETQLYGGKLNAEAGPYTVGTLIGGGTTYVSLSYSLGGGVGNVIQGDICNFSIAYNLTQN